MFAAEGLVHPLILRIWANFRQGFIIHQKPRITEIEREEAKVAWANVGIGCETVRFFYSFILFSKKKFYEIII